MFRFLVVLIVISYTGMMVIVLELKKIEDLFSKQNTIVAEVGKKYSYFYDQYIVDNHSNSVNRGDGIYIKKQ